jgi:chemotaxis protein MotA
MKAATLIGIVLAILGLLGGSVMEGTSPMAFFNLPAIIVVIGGTLGVSMASSGMEGMRLIPVLYKKAFAGAGDTDVPGRVATMVGFAERARREGLLALEDQVAEVDDAFLQKGMQLVVDGSDPELVREILEAEIEGMTMRHRAAVAVFEKAGGFAPTMGIIGTVMGLVHVLQNLSAPQTLGPSISGAFIATLIGVASANVVYLPVANRLKALSSAEAEERAMVLEGILSIQAGDNPRVVTEKLLSFVAPVDREAARAGIGGGPKLHAVPDGLAA